MKLKLLQSIIIVMLVFAMFGAPKPAAAQLYTYTSGYQVQNLENADALITLTYYSQQVGSTGGAQVTQTDDTIAALKSKTYFPIHAATGFKGSVVISSSTRLASIVNLVANGIGNASYIGFSGGSGTVYLPLLMKNNAGITTWYSVQNTSSTTNATVNVTYSDGAKAGPVVIKPNASVIFNQGAESTHTKTIFAATLTSSQPVAVVAVQEGTRVKTILASAGFTGGAAQAFMPLINANNAGYQTGVQIQNIGTLDTTVTVTYTPVPGYGTACWEKRLIKKGASETFALFAFAQAAPTAVSTCTKKQFVGGGQVTANTANQPLVAVVNQTTATIAGAYDSFSPTQVTGKVVLPLIMDRNSGWYTGFTLANVGNATVNVTCSLTGTTKTITGTLAKGAVLLHIQKDKIADRYVGSATCTATGTGEKKIVAVVNEIAAGTGDTLLVYEGINVP
jgi:hypothetical protein